MEGCTTLEDVAAADGELFRREEAIKECVYHLMGNWLLIVVSKPTIVPEAGSKKPERREFNPDRIQALSGICFMWFMWFMIVYMYSETPLTLTATRLVQHSRKES